MPPAALGAPADPAAAGRPGGGTGAAGAFRGGGTGLHGAGEPRPVGATPDATPGGATGRPATGRGSPAPGARAGEGARRTAPATGAAPAAEPGARQRPGAASRTPAVRPRTPRPLPPSRATRLVVPYLDIDAPVMGLRLGSDRRLPAPPDDDSNLVGWYEGGPAPGLRGTAVAVGHLDTDRGPAVFAGLTELKRGRVVEVRRADRRTAVYTVDAVKSYEKAHFPNEEVYGDRGRPELRLITCGGDYDRRKGYLGNIVVYAHLTAVRPP